MLHIGFDRFERAIAIGFVGQPGAYIIGIGSDLLISQIRSMLQFIAKLSHELRFRELRSIWACSPFLAKCRMRRQRRSHALRSVECHDRAHVDIAIP